MEVLCNGDQQCLFIAEIVFFFGYVKRANITTETIILLVNVKVHIMDDAKKSWETT